MKKSKLIPTIVVLNVIVFFMWSGMFNSFDERFMNKNFLVSWHHLSHGKYWTLITSVFSHNEGFHIFINMFVLMSFGKIIESILGKTKFILFYFVAGVVSSLSHCLVSTFFLYEPELSALGASGSIAGIILLFSLIYPKEKILFFGIIPIPALFGALAFIGVDLWGLFAQSRGGGLPIGHGAHLGGAFTGICFYFFYLKRSLNR